MKTLDFIIIGAQKSATTSLYRYLLKHPDIHMPPDKEAPFFSKENLYAGGWDAFVKEYFPDVLPDKLWGTATPQYMGDPRAAKRIFSLMPAVKLIAILRNPIDRAFSHYTMSVRRNMEKRSFAQAMDDLLKKDALDYGRKLSPPDHASGYIEEDADIHSYIVWGEYGRILKDYLHHFPRKQLLILFMEDLLHAPRETLQKVMLFISLDTDFEPDNLGKVYHKGGSGRIIPARWKDNLKKNVLFRTIWDRVPNRSKEVIRYWYEQKNVKKDTAGNKPDPSTRLKLIDHYGPDVKTIEELVGTRVPWDEFYT